MDDTPYVPCSCRHTVLIVCRRGVPKNTRDDEQRQHTVRVSVHGVYSLSVHTGAVSECSLRCLLTLFRTGIFSMFGCCFSRGDARWESGGWESGRAGSGRACGGETPPPPPSGRPRARWVGAEGRVVHGTQPRLRPPRAVTLDGDARSRPSSSEGPWSTTPRSPEPAHSLGGPSPHRVTSRGPCLFDFPSSGLIFL